MSSDTSRGSSPKNEKAPDIPLTVVKSSSEGDTEKAAPVEAKAHVIPDGGLKAWLTVFGAWLALCTTFGVNNAYGVFQDFYVRHYLTNYTSSEIAWIGSSQLFLQFALGLVAGVLFDRGYFHHTTILASIIYVLSYYMLSLCQEQQYYQFFLTQGIGAGIGSGLLFLTCISIVSHHFDRYRTFAMGIATTGGSVGGVVFPIMVNKLVESHGFHYAVRAVAYTSTSMLVVALALMRTNYPAERKVVVLPPLKQLLDTRFIFAITGGFFNNLGVFFPLFYLQLYAILHKVDHDLAFYSLSMINGVSILGRTLPNFIGDKVGLFNSVTVASLGCAITILCLLPVETAAGVYLIAGFYGFFSGAYISLTGPYIGSMCKDNNELGARMGIAFTFVAFSSLAGAPIDGELLGNTFKWERPIYFSSASLFLGAFFTIIARTYQVKLKGTQIV